MSNATSALKFWTSASPSWQGSNIRVEWTNAAGIQESSMGRFSDSDNEINWQYGEPPSRYEDVCLEAARYGTEYAVSQAEYMGEETWEQMDAQCAFRCCGCGVVQPSINDLSNDGHCSLCFIRLMGAA